VERVRTSHGDDDDRDDPPATADPSEHDARDREASAGLPPFDRYDLAFAT